MANIASGNITVFPSAKRANGDATYVKESRALSEQNLIGLVNQLLEVKSFVISNEWDDAKDFQFNIGGYLFTIKAGGYTPSGDDVYAHISTTTTDGYTELNGVESSGNYTGLTLDNTQSTSNDGLNLHILTKVDTSYVIPEESKLNLIN